MGAPAAPIAGEDNLGRVFRRGFATTLGMDLLARALSVVTVVVLVRGLGVSDYAFVTLFLAVAQFGGSAALGGIRTRYLREEAERVSRSESTRPAAFPSALASSVTVIVVLGAIGVVVAALSGIGHHKNSGLPLVLYACGFALSWGTIELTMAHWQAQRRFLLAGAVNVGRAAAMTAAALIVTTVAPGSPELALWFVGLMLAMAIASAGTALIAADYARPKLSRMLGLSPEERWLSIYYVGAAGFAYVDVLVAGALLQKHDIAALGAALRYLAIVLGVMPTLGTILRLRTAQADLVDSARAQSAMILRWVRRTLVPTALVVGAAIVVAPVAIPHVDGGRYPASILVLQIYLVTALVAYVTAPGPSILMTQRRYRFLAAVYGVGLAVNLAGDIAVARPFGITGIATVSTSVFIALDMLMIVSAFRYARVGSAGHNPRMQTTPPHRAGQPDCTENHTRVPGP